jgi:hypothetical protein
VEEIRIEDLDMSGKISLLALAVSVAAPVLAGTIIQASAYDDVSNLGYSAGDTLGISFVGTDTSNPTFGTSWTSYWIFNLPAGTGPFTSATFQLQPRAFFGDGSSEIANFTEFVLSPTLLTTAYAPDDPTGLSLYDALSSGASYGQLAVQPSDVLLDCQLPTCPSQPGSSLSVQLNSLGLTNINANLGGVFVIGAYLSPGLAALILRRDSAFVYLTKDKPPVL